MRIIIHKVLPRKTFYCVRKYFSHCVHFYFLRLLLKKKMENYLVYFAEDFQDYVGFQ